MVFLAQLDMMPVEKNDGINEIVLVPLMFYNVLYKQPSTASISFRISMFGIIPCGVETGIIHSVRQITAKKAVAFTGW